MLRRGLLALGVALSICSVALLAAEQKPSTKVYRVGILSMSSPALSPGVDTFRKEFRDLGYIEGRNLVIDVRWAEGRAERLPDLAAELVALKPDAIVTFTTNGALAAKQATTAVPIVMLQVSDPVGSGIIASLARPGGNITGVTDYGVDLMGKYVELVHAVVPKATRIGVLMSDNPIHPTQLKGIEEAGKAIGLVIVPAMDRSNEELEQAFAVLEKENAGVVIALGGATQANQRERIAELGVKTRMATLFPTRAYVEKGGLMSYGPNLPASYKLGVQYVDKILKGAKPADLPVEQPPQFELIINVKTAKALGLTIPQSLLLRANEVIQ